MKIHATMNTTAKTLLIAITIALSACGNPHKTIIPQTAALDNQEFMTSMKKLEQSEREKVVKWVMRKAFQGGIPAGTSIEQAIKEQTDWQAEQDAQTQRRAEAANRLNQAISWSLNQITFEPADYMNNRPSDRIVMKISITNNTDKPIKGVETNIQLKNNFDNELGNFTLQHEDQQPLNPQQSTTVQYNWDIFGERQIKDAVQANKVGQAIFATQTILYADGTKDSIGQ